MSRARTSPPVSRWWLVVLAALAMGLVGTYQFAWSAVRAPLGARVGASETALGTVFTVFLVFQALSQFPAGWVRDRYGPRLPLLVATPLVGVGYGWAAVAGTLPEVYLAYALGGIGAGVVYTVAVNTAVKWFTDRRGLATGVVTMSYSAVSFLLIPALRRGVDASFERTLLAMAVVLGAVAALGALVLRDPDAGDEDPDSRTHDEDDSQTTDEDDSRTTDEDGSRTHDPADSRTHDESDETDAPAYVWRETVRTWQFWLLYAVFAVVNGVGLMLIGKVITYADELALPAAAATAAASVVAAADAAGIALIGGLSDRLGRERTVSASLVLAGLAVAATAPVGTRGAAWWFVAVAGAGALFRGPAFSVFPSLVGDYYGQSHSSENYALLYTAKVWGSIFGGTVASALVVSIGWTDSFLLAGTLLAVSGVATAFLRPPDGSLR